MTAPHVYIVHFEGRDVECYGDLEEDSNFSIVCEDEYEDMVWCASNPVGDSFTSWEEVVFALQSYLTSDILEISAC